MTSREISGYFGETLELSHGEFRYWMYSDAGPTRETAGDYPLTGTYTIEGTRLVLNHPTFRAKEGVRIMDRVNGVPVLWRDDGWALWQEERKVHPYGVMIRVDRALLPFLHSGQPSLKEISYP